MTMTETNKTIRIPRNATFTSPVSKQKMVIIPKSEYDNMKENLYILGNPSLYGKLLETISTENRGKNA